LNSYLQFLGYLLKLIIEIWQNKAWPRWWSFIFIGFFPHFFLVWALGQIPIVFMHLYGWVDSLLCIVSNILECIIVCLPNIPLIDYFKLIVKTKLDAQKNPHLQTFSSNDIFVGV
jgi:hypothetical protein